MTSRNQRKAGTVLVLATGVALAATVTALERYAAADLVVYGFPIDGAQAGTPSPALGTGRAILDTNANELSWNIGFQGLVGAETAAHFHGPADYGMSAGTQVTIGVANPAVGSATLSAQQSADVQAGLWYVNIHSSSYASGEIRGQVVAPDWFFGMPHVLFGQAQASGGIGVDLVLTQLGINPDDYAVVILDCPFLTLRNRLMDPTSIPGTVSIDMSTFGVLDGVPNEPLVIGSLENVAEGWTVATEYHPTISPQTARVDTFLDGIPVDTRTFTSAGGFPDHWAELFTGDSDIEVDLDWWWWLQDQGELWSLVRIAQGDTLVTINGSSGQQADLIVIAVEDPGGTFGGSISEIQMRTTGGLHEITIPREGVGLFGHEHRALGQARFLGGANAIGVMNIGASGDDGVSIDLEGILQTPFDGGLRVDLEPIDLAVTANGCVTIEGEGTFDTIDEWPLGTAELALDAGVTIDVSADFGPIGSGSVLVEVYEGGSLVGTASEFSGDIVGSFAAGASITAVGQLVGEAPGMYVIMNQPVAFEPVSGGSLSGSEIRVIADAATGAVDRVAQFDIQATEIGSFTIIGEGPVGGGPCEGDSDGNGVIDIDDIVNVVLDFGTDGSANGGDVDGSGIVDIDDIVFVVLRFGSPC